MTNRPAKNLGSELLISLLITGVTVGVALLMQKPALRQALAMRAASYSRRFCQAQADFWQQAATASATAYHRARL